MYLLNPNKNKSSAHLWLDNDTVCKMYSTGGMRKKRQQLSPTHLGKPICTMCIANNKKLIHPLTVDAEYEKDIAEFNIALPL